jgi:hypothetical protein
LVRWLVGRSIHPHIAYFEICLRRNLVMSKSGYLKIAAPQESSRLVCFLTCLLGKHIFSSFFKEKVCFPDTGK